MIKKFSRRRALEQGRRADTPVPRPASFQDAFEQSPAPMTLVVGTGEPDGYLLRVNRAFAELLESTPDALALREVRDLTHPDDRDLFAEVGDGGVRVVRKRYLTGSGKTVPVLVRSRRVRDGGGTAVLHVNHVERERSSAVLRMNRDVVSTISDEVLTPLTSVQGYLEMVAEQDFGALTHEQQRLIRIATRNAARIEELVSDLLTLARLDIDGIDASRHERVNVQDIVNGALTLVRRAAGGAAREIRVELPRPPIEVWGQALLLERAVAGVIANAVKYTKDDGSVTVSAAAGMVSARITVADTGLGIAADELGRIADRFYRGTNAQHRAVSGTGLGLAIAKTVVDGHGGTLQFTSEPGVGTEVVVALPLATPAETDR
jgi:PAS domain S-box-containing protein